MPDIAGMLQEQVSTLIAKMSPPTQKLGWLLWSAHADNIGLEPSGRLRAFSEECVETGLLTRRQVVSADPGLPGGRRARRVVKDTGPFGGNPRLEFADVEAK